MHAPTCAAYVQAVGTAAHVVQVMATYHAQPLGPGEQAGECRVAASLAQHVCEGAALAVLSNDARRRLQAGAGKAWVGVWVIK